jgi:Lrp/AsnC family leucine-responsive transcriptional regulator
MHLDQIDLKILRALEADGRQSFAELADAIGLSKTPCWTRVQVLEKSGAIRGYRANVSPQALGLKVTAYVQVMIDAAKRDLFEEAVLLHPAIIECSTIAGEADYILKIYCSDVDGLDELLRRGISRIPGVQRTTTMICLKTIKDGGAVSAVGDYSGIA